MFAEGLDAVSVVVPTKLHKQVVLDALEAGVHVLVEKPIADTVENAKPDDRSCKRSRKGTHGRAYRTFQPCSHKA